MWLIPQKLVLQFVPLFTGIRTKVLVESGFSVRSLQARVSYS
jgi:hypothetical protein